MTRGIVALKEKDLPITMWSVLPSSAYPSYMAKEIVDAIYDGKIEEYIQENYEYTEDEYVEYYFDDASQPVPLLGNWFLSEKEWERALTFEYFYIVEKHGINYSMKIFSTNHSCRPILRFSRDDIVSGRAAAICGCLELLNMKNGVNPTLFTLENNELSGMKEAQSLLKARTSPEEIARVAADFTLPPFIISPVIKTLSEPDTLEFNVYLTKENCVDYKQKTTVSAQLLYTRPHAPSKKLICRFLCLVGDKRYLLPSPTFETTPACFSKKAPIFLAQFLRENTDVVAKIINLNFLDSIVRKCVKKAIGAYSIGDASYKSAWRDAEPPTFLWPIVPESIFSADYAKVISNLHGIFSVAIQSAFTDPILGKTISINDRQDLLENAFYQAFPGAEDCGFLRNITRLDKPYQIGINLCAAPSELRIMNAELLLFRYIEPVFQPPSADTAADILLHSCLSIEKIVLFSEESATAEPLYLLRSNSLAPREVQQVIHESYNRWTCVLKTLDGHTEEIQGMSDQDFLLQVYPDVISMLPTLYQRGGSCLWPSFSGASLPLSECTIPSGWRAAVGAYQCGHCSVVATGPNLTSAQAETAKTEAEASLCPYCSIVEH